MALPPPDIDQILSRSDWRQRLVAEYEDVAERLNRAYVRLLPRLQEAAGEFSVQLRLIADDGARITAQELRDLTAYQRLLARTETELADFAVLMRNEAAGLNEGAIQIGADAAESMALAQNARLAAAWVRPDPAALQRLIGYLDNPAMQANFRQFGANAAQQLSDIILAGTAQGKGPGALTTLIQTWIRGVPPSWADNTLRTIQLWSMRTASNGTYAANARLLDGWIWWAERSTRTCISCWNQHGTLHPASEILDDHHRGRCVPVPAVIGTNWYRNLPTGQELFEDLSVADQRAIMGGALFTAWRAGEVGWTDFSRHYGDDVYTRMRGAPSLVELLGNRARQFYARR